MSAAARGVEATYVVTDEADALALEEHMAGADPAPMVETVDPCGCVR